MKESWDLTGRDRLSGGPGRRFALVPVPPAVGPPILVCQAPDVVGVGRNSFVFHQPSRVLKRVSRRSVDVWEENGRCAVRLQGKNRHVLVFERFKLKDMVWRSAQPGVVCHFGGGIILELYPGSGVKFEILDLQTTFMQPTPIGPERPIEPPPGCKKRRVLFQPKPRRAHGSGSATRVDRSIWRPSTTMTAAPAPRATPSVLCRRRPDLDLRHRSWCRPP